MGTARSGSLLLSGALALLLAPSARAADDDARACAAIAEPSARLACYDAVYPPSQPQRTVSAEDRFGLSGLSREQQRAALGLPAPPDRIEARIVALTLARDRRRLLTLDNGQRWVVPPEASNDRLAVGDRVEIRDAALSAHRLVTPQGIAIRAKRVR